MDEDFNEFRKLVLLANFRGELEVLSKKYIDKDNDKELNQQAKIEIEALLNNYLENLKC